VEEVTALRIILEISNYLFLKGAFHHLLSEKSVYKLSVILSRKSKKSD